MGFILLSLGGIIYQVYESLERQKEASIDPDAIEGMLPKAVQWIQDFRRVEIREGKKRWEIRGDEAQYLEDSGRVLVHGPRAAFYSDEGERITVRGEEGSLVFDGQELRQVELRNSIRIAVRDVVVRGTEAHYDRKANRIVVEGPVEIRGAGLAIEGTKMVVHVAEQRAELYEDVHAVLRPAVQDTAKPTES